MPGMVQQPAYIFPGLPNGYSYAGSIPFIGTGPSWGESVNLYWDNTNGRMAINRPASYVFPTLNLAVFGNANGTRVGIEDGSSNGSWNNSDLGGIVWRTHFATTESVGIYAVGNPTGLPTSTNPYLQFKVNAGAAIGMTLGPSGRALFGPSGKEAPDGSTYTQVSIGADLTFQSGLAIQTTQSTGNYYPAIFFYGNTQTGWILSTSTGVTYNTASDYRLKENVETMTGALAKVLQLRPVTYTWKSNGVADQGFLAHELQAIIPQAVSGEKDEVDDNGKPRYQGVDLSKVVPDLVAALQEMATRLAALEAKVG